MKQTLQKIKAARRIVVKVGTSTLTHENGGTNLRLLSRLSHVLSDLRGAGKEVVLVTSGAMGVGVGKLGLNERPKDTPTRQAAAAVGQCVLMTMYDRMFWESGQLVAQLLLTKHDTEKPESRRNLQNAFERLLALGVVPIVNENDSVAVEELEGKFGDNDKLSAIAARLIDADLLILMTDTEGLFVSNPRENSDAQVIPFVPRVTDEVLGLANGKGSPRGTGGMITKLLAAQLATKADIPTVIMNGSAPERLYDLLGGNAIGTLFGTLE
ncbi:MAG: glutamate 5-kinase [Oscillospiraceae bacterium]|nr:glutamate 5-kinase [Oscillospiraceae bacterium]